MNVKIVKSISLAAVLMCALLLVGVAGALDPALAANEIIINSGLPVSNYHQVSLALTPPTGSATMSFRNGSDPWSAEEAAASTKQWGLSGPDGDKKVSVQFKNGSGTILGTYSDTIKLDYIIDTGFFSPNGSTNYGNPGQTNTTGKAVAVQPVDQKIVVVGTYDNGGGNTQLEVIRYNPDGTYDTGFGAGTGKVFYGNATGAYSGTGVAVLPDGKILVVGTYEISAGRTGLWLLKLTSNGSLDPAFNPSLGGGYLVLGGIGLNSGNAVAVKPGILPDHSDDKIVVVGTYDNGGSNNTTPWILRFNLDGSPDTTFNFTGEVTLSAAAGAHTGNGLALDPGGRAVVVGTYDHGGGNTSVWTLRLTSDGQLDPTFGRSTVGNPLIKLGYDTFGFNGAHSGSGVAINPITGTIHVVGTWDWTGGDTDIWLLQLNSDGTLDPTFNPNATGVPPGTVALGGSGVDSGSAAKIQSDGKLVIVGTYDNGFSGTSLLVQRFNTDGSYDTTFNKGNSAYSFGLPGIFAGQGIALQSDNRIIVTGMGYGKINNVSLSTILTLRLNDHTLPLTVATVGSGTVTVTPGMPGDFTWVGSAGSGDYLPGTVVQLTAVPTPGGATFVGWSGACSGTGPCSVTMDAARDVTATFSLPFDLTVKISGAGTGTVATNQPGFSCAGSECSAPFPPNTSVVLTAVPAWYSLFSSWTGCDTVVGNACTVSVNRALTVTASFSQNMTVRLVGKRDYPTLHDGYVAAEASGLTPPVILQAKVFTFLENLNFNLPVTVTLQGGKDDTFSTVPVGFTTVSGSLRISSGRLNATYLYIRP